MLTEKSQELEQHKAKTTALESEIESLKKECEKVETYKEKIRELQAQAESNKAIREKMKLLETQMEMFKKEKDSKQEGDGSDSGGGQSREELQKVRK